MIFLANRSTLWFVAGRLRIPGSSHNFYVHRNYGREYSNDFRLVCKSVEAGLGIACLPAFYVARAEKRGELVPILCDYTVKPKDDIYAIYPSRKYLFKKTQMLVRFLKEKVDRI